MNSDAPILDLSIHDFDDLPGKRVIINDVPNRIVDLIGAGGEGSVYRIRNERTGVVTLALKVYMFTPASPEYQKIKHNGIRNFQSKAVVASENDPGGSHLLINGRTLRTKRWAFGADAMLGPQSG
jgi:hypothetical protein